MASKDSEVPSQEEKDTSEWKKSITSILKDSKTCQVKKLRKLVLLSMQMDENEKASKKAFKKVMKTLEQENVVSIDGDGDVTYIKKKKRKSGDEGDEKKKKKKKSKKDSEDAEPETEKNDEEQEETTASSTPAPTDAELKNKSKPCVGNPQGVTRLFLGNLPFAVDENSLSEYLPGIVTHIKWITDKETGKFYGSAFVEMDNSKNAAKAVAMAGNQFMGRPLKINFAPARSGDVWPPEESVISGNGAKTRQAGGTGKTAMSPKPEGCLKLFLGNLSFELDEEKLRQFFEAVSAEPKAIRWLHHKDSGDFKGCGYVEFWDTQACDKAAELNGKSLLGRHIRIDWTD